MGRGLKNIKLKTFLILATCHLLLATTFSPAFGTEIVLWHSMPDFYCGAFEDLIDEFNKLNPTMKVKPIFCGGYEDTQAKLLAAAMSRTLPDVSHIIMEYVPLLAHQGMLRDLKPFFSRQAKDIYEDVPDEIWALVGGPEHLWGMPYDITAVVFYYNKDLFRQSGLDPDKPPTTWEELVETAQKLTIDKNGDGKPDQWGLKWPTSSFIFQALIWQNGGEILSEDGRCTFNSPACLEALEFLVDLAHKYKVMNPLMSFNEARQSFLMGRIAMGPEISGGISFAEENLPWELGISILPKNKISATPLTGGCLSILTKDPKKIKVCQKLFKWLASTWSNTKWHINTGFIPLRKSVSTSLETQLFHMEHPNFKVLFDPELGLRPGYRFRNISRMRTVVEETLSAALLKKGDLQKLLDRATKQINEILKEDY